MTNRHTDIHADNSTYNLINEIKYHTAERIRVEKKKTTIACQKKKKIPKDLKRRFISTFSIPDVPKYAFSFSKNLFSCAKNILIPNINERI